MPNRGAKDRKAKRQQLNKKFAREGRTANQVKKYKAKLRAQGINPNQRRFQMSMTINLAAGILFFCWVVIVMIAIGGWAFKTIEPIELDEIDRDNIL